jgi:hypothetical protein
MPAANDPYEQLMQAVGLANQKTAAGSAAVQSILADQQAAQADMVQKAALTGDSQGQTAIMAAAADTAKIKAQSDSINAATAIGTNPDAASFIMAYEGNAWRESSAAAIQAKNDLQDKLNLKITDNPAQWVLNQLTMGSTIQAADSAQAVADAHKERLMTAQKLTQEAVVTNTALMQTVTQASAESHLKSVQAAIDMNVDRVKIANAGNNIQGIQAMQGLSMQQVSLMNTANQTETAAEQFEMQKKEFNLRQQQFVMQKKQFDAAMEDRTQTKEQEQIFSNYIAKGLSAMGYEQDALTPGPKLLAFYKAGGERYKQALAIGQNLTASNGYPVISENAGVTARVIATTGAPLKPTDGNIRTLLQTSWAQANDPKFAAMNQYDVNKPEQVMGATSKLATTEATKMLGDVESGGVTNIYAPQGMAQVVNAIPAVAQSNFVQKVLQPQLATGVPQDFRASTILGLAKAAIQNGTIPLNADTIQEIRNTFNAAVIQNENTHAYRGKGLPNQSTYNTNLTTGFMGGLQKYNFNDVKDVSRALNYMLYSDQWAKQQGQGVAGPHD